MSAPFDPQEVRYDERGRVPTAMAVEQLRWDERGLIPAVVQDTVTRQVLMLAWMNAEALRLTLSTGQVHFWSRSRAELWRKGATSGNTLALVELRADCDGDALLVLARPAGPACHTGAVSCFYQETKPAVV